MTEDAAHKRTFAAGEWYAVVGDQVTALLPADARARVAGLWDLADGGAELRRGARRPARRWPQRPLRLRARRPRRAAPACWSAARSRPPSIPPQGDVDVAARPRAPVGRAHARRRHRRSHRGSTIRQPGRPRRSSRRARRRRVQFGEPATVGRAAPAEQAPVASRARPARSGRVAVGGGRAGRGRRRSSPAGRGPSPAPPRARPSSPRPSSPTPEPEPEPAPLPRPSRCRLRRPTRSPSRLPAASCPRARRSSPRRPPASPSASAPPSGDDPTPTGEQPAVTDDVALAATVDHDGQTTVGRAGGGLRPPPGRASPARSSRPQWSRTPSPS